MVSVYGLFDATMLPRYIGVTTDIERRLDRHVQEALALAGTHKRHWIRSVLEAGQSVEIVQLDIAPTRSVALSLERAYIAEFRANGALLTNATSGGEGLCEPSDDTRAKMRAAHLGRTHSEATKLKMRHPKRYPPTRRSREVTEEFRQRMRTVALARKPPSDEVKHRISESRKGQKLKPETRVAISKINCARWSVFSPEKRASIVEAVALSGGVGSTSCAKYGASARWLKAER